MVLERTILPYQEIPGDVKSLPRGLRRDASSEVVPASQYRRHIEEFTSSWLGYRSQKEGGFLMPNGNVTVSFPDIVENCAKRIGSRNKRKIEQAVFSGFYVAALQEALLTLGRHRDIDWGEASELIDFLEETSLDAASQPRFPITNRELAFGYKMLEAVTSYIEDDRSGLKAHAYKDVARDVYLLAMQDPQQPTPDPETPKDPANAVALEVPKDNISHFPARRIA